MTAGTTAPATAVPSSRLVALLVAAHGGPAIAVTVLAGLLSAAVGLAPARAALVVAAVLTGQLSIGWANDLIDLGRDRTVGRLDKPLVTGALPVAWVRIALALAVLACVPLSLACGWAAGVTNLACAAAGWAYDLGLKSSWWSWLPYAVAFGGLPVFVALADGSGAPPWWWPTAAALQAVAAHLLNVLPDLDQDEATGVRGFGHRVGPRRIPAAAAGLLVAGTAVILLGAAVAPPLGVAAGAVTLALAGYVVTSTGKRPFAAAIGIALVDAAVLLVTR